MRAPVPVVLHIYDVHDEGHAVLLQKASVPSFRKQVQALCTGKVFVDFLENAGSDKGVYKIKIVKLEDVDIVKDKLSKTFKVRQCSERSMERAKDRYQKLEDQAQSQLSARELYDFVARSSSPLMVSVMASAQQRADDAVAKRRRKK